MSGGFSKDSPLTAKRRRFCEEYIIDSNGLQAAIRAGYSPRCAGEEATRLLKNAQVQLHLSLLRDKQLERVEITTDTILRELLMLARADISQAFKEDGSLKPIHEIPEATRRAIASVEVVEMAGGMSVKTGEDGGVAHVPMYVKKVKFWDKPKALELLGKHLKMWTEMLEVKALGQEKFIERLLEASLPEQRTH